MFWVYCFCKTWKNLSFF